jgi:hypothetical protein
MIGKAAKLKFAGRQMMAGTPIYRNVQPPARAAEQPSTPSLRSLGSPAVLAAQQRRSSH